MPDHRSVLERGLQEFRAPELPLEAILRRRDRRRRNQRIAAGVVGLAIGIAAILIGASLIRADKMTPATPELPYRHNGVIALLGGDTLTLFDPRTEVSSKLSLRAGRGGYSVTGFTWSPDGKKFAYTTEQQGTVRVFDLKTHSITTIVPCEASRDDPGCVANLAWSPDGSRIALSGYDGLELVDPDGSNLTTLIAHGYVGPPTWSPDGTTIAFTASFASAEPQAVYEVDADGSNLRVLFEQPGSGRPGGLRWSPDGTRIAYLVTAPNSDPDGLRGPSTSIIPQVWIVDADGSRPSKLFAGGACCAGGNWTGLSWSPDGSTIAFIATPPGSAYGSKHSSGLYAIDPVDGDAEVLAWHVFLQGPPAWQPIP